MIPSLLRTALLAVNWIGWLRPMWHGCSPDPNQGSVNAGETPGSQVFLKYATAALARTPMLLQVDVRGGRCEENPRTSGHY